MGGERFGSFFFLFPSAILLYELVFLLLFFDRACFTDWDWPASEGLVLSFFLPLSLSLSLAWRNGVTGRLLLRCFQWNGRYSDLSQELYVQKVTTYLPFFFYREILV